MIEVAAVLYVVFQVLQVMVIPIAIGSTVLLILAIANEWATRSYRKASYVALSRSGIQLLYLLLFVDLYWNITLIVRITAIGFVDPDRTESVLRALMSLFGTTLVYMVCIVVSLAIIKFCEDGKQITDEQRAEWRRARQAELETQRVGRRNQ